MTGAVDFEACWHPVAAVACPDCGKRAGARCVRPSGHGAADFHAARKRLADEVFIAQHGPTAWIERLPDSWRIHPDGGPAAAPAGPGQLDLFAATERRTG